MCDIFIANWYGHEIIKKGTNKSIYLFVHLSIQVLHDLLLVSKWDFLRWFLSVSWGVDESLGQQSPKHKWYSHPLCV